MDDVITTASELIAVRSTADEPDELRRALTRVLDFVGPGFAVRRYESNGKPSALVHPHGAQGPFRVVLNAHLDVVPGQPEQFTPRRAGGRVHGRGAQDMKFAAVVLADVFRRLAGELTVPIALQLVTDEEVGGLDGTAHQVAAGVRADFVIIGEQSRLEVVTESKGLVHARLIAAGSAAHAAYPWLGDNALVALTAAVDRVLRRYPVPPAEAWRTTVNVARIETPNRAVNQVPAQASAWLDIRFPPHDTDFAGRDPAQVAGHLRAVSGVAVEVDAVGAPHRADPAGADVTRLRAAVRGVGYPGTLLRKHGAADGRHYYAHGIDAVIFGPGGDGQHGAGEYVDLDTLAPYRDALTAFLRSL